MSAFAINMFWKREEREKVKNQERLRKTGRNARMTEQEMNKIIAEVAKVVKTEMKNEIEVKNGRNVTKPLEQQKGGDE